MQLWRGLDMASFDETTAQMPRQEVLQYLRAFVSRIQVLAVSKPIYSSTAVMANSYHGARYS